MATDKPSANLPPATNLAIIAAGFGVLDQVQSDLIGLEVAFSALQQGLPSTVQVKLDALAVQLNAAILQVSITANQTVNNEATYRVANINQVAAQLTTAYTALVAIERQARIDGDAAAADALLPLKASLGSLSDSVAAARAEAQQATLTAVMGSDRPGDSPASYTRVSDPAMLQGVRTALQPLSPDALASSDFGMVARLQGAGVIGTRRVSAVEIGRLYRLRAVVRRVTNSPDPSGDAVRIALVALDQSLLILPNTDGVVEAKDFQNLVADAGRQPVDVLFAVSPGRGNTLTLPPRTRFVVPAVITYGTGSLTTVEVLDVEDVTGAFLLAPPVLDFDARLSALESADLPARVSAAEIEINNPLTVTFRNKGDARYGTIPESVQLVQLLGRQYGGDGGAGLYIRTAAPLSPGADSFTSHGANFVRVQLAPDVAAAIVAAGFSTWFDTLPQTLPDKPDLPWNNGGLFSVSQ